jgi:polygalacturonase
VDINSSQKVIVKNSFLRCNDDCVVLKAMGERSYYPNKKPAAQNVDSVLIDNCVLWNMAWGNALEIGFELRSGEVKNVIFRDCDIINVERGAALSIHNGDWAHVHDILYENIRIENAQHKIFDVAIFLSQYSYDRPEDETIRQQQYMHGAWDGVQIEQPGKKEFHKQFRGKISDITFRNISIMDGPVPFSLFVGYDETHEIENVKIENYSYYGRTARNIHEGRIFIRNIEDFAISF